MELVAFCWSLSAPGSGVRVPHLLPLQGQGRGSSGGLLSHTTEFLTKTLLAHLEDISVVTEGELGIVWVQVCPNSAMFFPTKGGVSFRSQFLCP